MKKIMFNDKYGLTAAVLNGKKTMTRRIVTNVNLLQWLNELDDDGAIRTIKGTILSEENSAYKVGEIVAVAQSYQDLEWQLEKRDYKRTDHSFDNYYRERQFGRVCDSDAGWKNKMFVRADLMPHHIQMTSLKIEKLQDISNEDAMREGVFKYDKPPLFHEFDPYSPWPPFVKPYKHDHDNMRYFCEARFAFAHLIDRVSRIGMWNINPWVLAYSFERID